jgi:hypothetical protein
MVDGPEITPAMIEAGVLALERFTDSGTIPERLVRLIYLAMYKYSDASKRLIPLSQVALDVVCGRS